MLNRRRLNPVIPRERNMANSESDNSTPALLTSFPPLSSADKAALRRITHQAYEAGISFINQRAIRNAIRRISDDPIAATLEAIQYAQAGGKSGRNVLEHLEWLVEQPYGNNEAVGYLPLRAKKILPLVDHSELDTCPLLAEAPQNA